MTNPAPAELTTQLEGYRSLADEWEEKYEDSASSCRHLKKQLAAREETFKINLQVRDDRVKVLEEALRLSIHELECSGLCLDHPLIVELQQALTKGDV